MIAKRARAWRARGRSLAIFLFALVASTPAFAQTTPAVGSYRSEAAVGAVFLGAMNLGASGIDFAKPDGTGLTVFRAERSLSPGAGIEAHVGTHVASRLSAEVTGSWVRTEVRAEISSDVEGVPATTAATGLTRFSIEGSALWTVASTQRTSLFVRGGVGWMRELAGEFALAEDGVIGSVGAGVKYWWSRAGAKRLGVRVDGRAVLRSGGMALGSTAVRVAPAASADLLMGF